MRLTNAIREDIVKKLIARKFKEKWEAEWKRKEAFVWKAYESILKAEERAWLLSIPNSFRSGLGRGSYRNMYFGGQVCGWCSPEDKPLILSEEINKRLRFGADNPLTEEFNQINREIWALESQRRKAEREAEAVLKSVQTLKQLIEVWPEIEPFCPKPVAKESTAIAIRRDELNNTFGLPVENNAHAEK